MLAIEEVAERSFPAAVASAASPRGETVVSIAVDFRRRLGEQLIAPERPLRKRSGADAPAGVDRRVRWRERAERRPAWRWPGTSRRRQSAECLGDTLASSLVNELNRLDVRSSDLRPALHVAAPVLILRRLLQKHAILDQRSTGFESR